MRRISIDIDFVLSVLGTARNGYTWVNIPRREVPSEIQAVFRGDLMELKIIYLPVARGIVEINIPGTAIKVFVCSSDGIVVGTHLRDRQELNTLLDWLRLQQGYSNIAKIRDNYRVIGAILRDVADQLL